MAAALALPASDALSAIRFAPMAQMAAAPTERFGPTLTAAQARAALLTPEQRTAEVAKIGTSAKSFEASFVSTMLGNMFQGVDLGGGQGGEAFKSVLMEAVGKKIVAAGGVGLAKSVQAEMLKMQGLS